jgi:DNA-binding CsgD family transcriptional regulator
VLATAVEGNAIPQNPCDGVRLPRSEREEMVFLALDDVHALAAALRRPEYAVLVRFVALTGLRAGEVGALRIGRVDLLRGRVDVVEAVSEVTGLGLDYGPTKTYERRSVPIPRGDVRRTRGLSRRPAGRPGGVRLHRVRRWPVAPPQLLRPPFQSLTERELEVLRLLATGKSTGELAAELYIGERTVKAHVSGLPTKLGLRDRVQAVVDAFEARLMHPHL